MVIHITTSSVSILFFNYKVLLCRIDHTYKFYYGGAQKRPDAPYMMAIKSAEGKVIAHVGEGNRKDVRNAVEVAHKAAPG